MRNVITASVTVRVRTNREDRATMVAGVVETAHALPHSLRLFAGLAAKKRKGPKPCYQRGEGPQALGASWPAAAARMSVRRSSLSRGRSGRSAFSRSRG
jgi:hypothetical protein